MDSSRLVTIASFGSVEEADLARMVLEEEGIPAALEGRAVVGLLWHLTNAVGGVKLQVLAEDVPRARAVLTRPAAGGEAAEPFLGPTTCPQCGAEMEPGFGACWSCETPLDQATSPTATPQPTEAQSDAEETCSEEGDAIARRAWHAAVLGLFVCPPLLNLYSVWLLFKIGLSDMPLSDAGQRRFRWAIIADFLACAGLGIWHTCLMRGL